MAKVKDSDKGFAHEDLEGYDSSFEDEDSQEKQQETKKRCDLTQQSQKIASSSTAATAYSAGIPPKSYFEDEKRRAEGFRNRYFSLNAFERHKKLINDYFLYFPGSAKLLQRDTSKDKRDIDVIREHHRFLWEDSDEANTWGKQLAKKYYDKLYKEYTICDLSRYIENKVAMRWRIEKELMDGKGQFVCGSKHCSNADDLRTWEVNFAYREEGSKKNALVKLRLCPECSVKLNHGYKRKEVTKKSSKKRKRGRGHKRKRHSSDEEEAESEESASKPEAESTESDDTLAKNIWKGPVPVVTTKSREEEFDEYLDDLFV